MSSKKGREGMLTTLREVMLATLINIHMQILFLNPSQGHMATVTKVQMLSANCNKTAVPIVDLKTLYKNNNERRRNVKCRRESDKR